MAYDRGVPGKCRFCRMEAREAKAARFAKAPGAEGEAGPAPSPGNGRSTVEAAAAEAAPAASVVAATPKAVRQGPAIDYKEVRTLQRLSTPQGKLFSRKRSGTCATHQRQVKRAIKRARFMALLPYVGR